MPWGPLVSIGIPSYNHGRFLGAAIESALAQTHRPIEIVIVDDGSSDNSLAIAHRYEATHSGVIRVLTHPGGHNRGGGATANLSLAESRGEFFCGLPSDDLLAPTKIERQVALLARRPEVGLVYSYAAFVDAAGRPIPGGGRYGIDKTRGPRPFVEHVIESNPVPAMTALVRTRCIDRVGRLRENLLYADWDWWTRLAAHFPVAFMAEHTASYRLHGHNVSRGARMHRELSVASQLAVTDGLAMRAESICGGLASRRVRALLALQIAFLRFAAGEPSRAETAVAEAFALDERLAGDPDFLVGWLVRRAFDRQARPSSAGAHRRGAHGLLTSPHRCSGDSAGDAFVPWAIAHLPTAAHARFAWSHWRRLASAERVAAGVAEATTSGGARRRTLRDLVGAVLTDPTALTARPVAVGIARATIGPSVSGRPRSAARLAGDLMHAVGRSARTPTRDAQPTQRPIDGS